VLLLVNASRRNTPAWWWLNMAVVRSHSALLFCLLAVLSGAAVFAGLSTNPAILCPPLSKEQLEAIAAARAGLLSELHRVASEWQSVLPTLALQLLQVPRAQWHSVAAVQAMVMNLAAEREAVVGFLHTVIDEVRAIF
jgi:hypothetical protein